MIEQLRTRRSIRSYTDRSIDPQVLSIMKETLLRSPSSRGINPWEFVFVDDRETLISLSKCKEHGSSFLAHAALGVVIGGDETKSDVWVEDCSIAAILLQMEAHARGLGSCWIQIRNRRHDKTITSEDYVRRELSIPSHIRIGSIISIGWPAEVKEPVSEQSLPQYKIHSRTW